jgi:hypothetical protein
VQRIVGGGLVGGDIKRDAVGDQPRGDVGDVGDQRDRAAVAAALELGERAGVVVGDDIDPAGRGPARRSLGVDLDDQRSAAEVGDRQALSAAHPSEPGGQHASAGQRAAEVAAGDGDERLVREAEDPLGADVEPGRGGHLTEHRQPGRLQPLELRLTRPLRHEHRGRDQHPRGVRVRRQHGDRSPGLDQQRLVAPQPSQRGHDPVVIGPAARGAALAAVDHEAGRVLGDLRVKRPPGQACSSGRARPPAPSRGNAA